MIFLCLCLTDSLSVTRSRSIHVAANGTVSFFLTAEQYSIVYMNHIFIHSSVDGYLLFFISWKLITLQYCSGFVIYWYESALDIHVFPIPIPPPTSLSTRSLWVFPVHQAWALVSCIPPGLVICFTLDIIHVSMLFSWNIPPSPSPTESKSLFYTSVSLFLFCI